jgi:hypothetical protein
MKIARRPIDAADAEGGLGPAGRSRHDPEGRASARRVEPLPDRGVSPAEWIWWQPSVSIVATTLPTRDVKKNALRQQASALAQRASRARTDRRRDDGGAEGKSSSRIHRAAYK